MTNQVTSIEQSNRLIELGIPKEKASFVWTTVDDNKTVVERDLCLPENIEGYAFTVADLLAMLPDEIDADCGLCYLQIKKLYANSDYTEWGVYYKNHEGDTPFESITTFGIVEALFDMVEKIICYGGCCELNL